MVVSLLLEISLKPSHVPNILCDNNGARTLFQNLVFHSRSKHIKLDAHSGLLEVQYLNTMDQIADFLIKPLSTAYFQPLAFKLKVFPQLVFNH